MGSDLQELDHLMQDWILKMSLFCADLPVRMALGETHVVSLTKSALGDAGVDVEALEAAAAAVGERNNGAGKKTLERSDRTLLVKNLPYSATEADLMVNPELQL